MSEATRRASIIESLLFVSGEPISIRRLAHVLDWSTGEVRSALQLTANAMVHRGIRLQLDGDQVQLVTAPENAEFVRRFLGLQRSAQLSRPALETLSIVAYRQPVTRGEIEEIRGVAADRVLAGLVSRGLVEERGRRRTPGRPIQYGTTFAFLEAFGLSGLQDLPGTDADLPAQASFGILGLKEDAEAVQPALS